MKKLLPWLALAFILRLVLIPISLHPDFRAVNLAGYLIAQKGQLFSFYDFLSRQPRSDHWVQLYGDNLFIYPPLAYLTHALFNKVLFWAYPQAAFFTLINDIGRLRLDPGFPLLMYLLKLPYLIADVACLLILFNLLPPKSKFIGCLLWAFNPITIYSAYLVGQFDIFIALFLLIAIYHSANHPVLSAVSLGLSAAFKPFVLVLAPFLPGHSLKNTLISGLTYGLTLLPYLASPAFRQYAFLASQSDKLFFAKIMISGSQYLPLFVVGLICLLYWRYFFPHSFSPVGWLSLPLFLFFSVTHYHPQWFTWVAPLLVYLFAVDKKTRLPILTLIFCYVFIVFSFDSSLNFGLFNLSVSLPIPDLYTSIVRGIFAATAIFITFQLRESPHGQNKS
jgi:hypothetical protein